MATTDIRDVVGKNTPQRSRRVEIPKTIDCAATPVTATNSLLFAKTPKGFIYERTDVHLITAEGGTGTIDIGITGDTDGLLDGGNVNGTPGALVARAGTESIAAGAVLSEKELLILANNDLDLAKFQVVVVGYVQDDVG